MAETLGATVAVGGQTYTCRVRLKHWKGGVESVSGAGRETLFGLPDWSGTLYPPNGDAGRLREILEAAHFSEDAMLRIGDCEAPFSVDDSADPGSGELDIHARGSFKQVGSA
ncbi:hypothetical protein [Streptomyces sp. NPDC002952]|uniref:hypothetical protein n=1 Tax=Streptomyces sp. NPDC002952 TaxID=3364673 RepID=UPI0036AFEBBB